MQHFTRLAILFIVLLVTPASADIIRVPADQPTIQAGIDAATGGDTVLVADGTYTGEGNRDIRFRGKSIILRSENGPENCVIDASAGSPYQVFIFDGGENHRAVLEGFTITGGESDPGEYEWGGGIYCGNVSSPTILGNIITGNASNNGAGIAISDSSGPNIVGNIITGNQLLDHQGSPGHGGGIFLFYCGGTPLMLIRDNVISWNEAYLSGQGTAVYSHWSFFLMENNLVVHNGGTPGEAYEAMAFVSDSYVLIRNTTLADNDVDHGGAIRISDSTVYIDDSIISNDCETQIMIERGTSCTVRYSDVRGGWAGEGNIDADPLFVSGPYGDHCLSHIATGQPADSPCVDAGNPETGLIAGSTRTDLVQDLQIIDMGYHAPADLPSRVVIGPGPAWANPPDVRVYPPVQDGVHEFEFAAYGSHHFGINVTTGEVTGDDIDEIITGPGPGEELGPHVRGFEVDGTPLPGLSFLAYGTASWGVNVVAGDIDGDGFDEIVTGPGPGKPFGPHVRGWDYDDSGAVTAIAAVNFFAYGTPQWGVNVAAGDIDGDGFDEIVTGPGPGAIYGPHVRGWDYDGTAVAAIPAVSFMAYGTNLNGVRVSCGDVDGDGIDELVTAPGPSVSHGMHIRGWDFDGSEVTPLPGLSFFPYAYPLARFGATVFAGTDLDGGGRDELVVGCGPDPECGTPVKVYTYDGTQVYEWLFIWGYRWLTHGTSVAAGRF